MNEQSTEFVGQYSIGKTLTAAVVMLGAAILPIIPWENGELMYSSFLYHSVLYYLLLACCIVNAVLSLIALRMLWRALLKLPAMIISDRCIIIYEKYKTVLNVSDIISVKLQIGRAIIKLANGKKVTVPFILCKDPNTILVHLSALSDGR